MLEIDLMDTEAVTNVNREGKYLTFTLAEEDYGIGILRVKEIIGMMAITPVPRTPSYLKGVINLRGKVIPIVDLRRRFFMAALVATEKTCIIVVEVAGGSRKVMIGILVDSVSEVVNIKGCDIEDRPKFGAGPETDYILGMAKTVGKVKILLDIDRVFNSEEDVSLAAVA